MATYTKFQDFIEQVGKGVHHLHAAGDTLKAFLSNELPLAADTVKTDIAEIAAGNGYTAGGADIQNDYSETSGTGTLTAVDPPAWTAAGGTIGPFQYVVIYNDTAASDNLVCWYDHGSAVTLQIGDSFTLDFGASLLTLGP